MFSAYVVVIEVASFIDSVFDDFFGARGLREFSHCDHVGAGLYEFFDLEADFTQVNVHVFQDIGADARAFLDEAKEDVFGTDPFMVETLGFLIGQGHDLACSVCKSFKHAFVLFVSLGVSLVLKNGHITV